MEQIKKIEEKNWNDIIEALRYEYTTSLKDTCQLTNTLDHM